MFWERWKEGLFVCLFVAGLIGLFLRLGFTCVALADLELVWEIKLTLNSPDLPASPT